MPVDHTTAKEVIEAAHKAVVESAVPEPFQAVAFAKAFDLLAGGAQVPPPAAPPAAAVTGNGEPTADQRLEKIAAKVGVDATKLAYIYELDDEGVSLVVQRSKLASDKANATREVALLYGAARQAGGYDATHTPSSEIKARVNDMGVLDDGNYAATLSGQKDWFAMKGKGMNREFRVTQHGYEEAAKIVTRITGGGS